MKEQTYNDIIWLDRNIGALAAEAGNYLSNGLYFQFGRKDPFRGAASTTANTQMVTTGEWSHTTTIPSNPEQYVIANPMMLISNNTTPQDWYATSTAKQNHNLWNSSGKTMYDPCPAGYRVPGKLSWNKGMKSGDENAFFTTSNFIYENGCLVYTEGDMKVVYPICGCISAAGVLTNVNKKGYYRTSDQFGSKATNNHMEITPTTVDTSEGVYRASGDSIRCVRE